MKEAERYRNYVGDLFKLSRFLPNASHLLHIEKHREDINQSVATVTKAQDEQKVRDKNNLLQYSM